MAGTFVPCYRKLGQEKKGNCMEEQAKLTELKGVGKKTAELFARVGVETLEDLVHYYPRSYEVYEAPVPVAGLEEGKVQAVTGVVAGNVKMGGSPRLSVTTAWLKDETGTLKTVWFRMPFLRNTLRPGSRITVRGRVAERKGELLMEHPEIFQPSEQYAEKMDTMQPLYPLTAGLGNKTVVKVMRQALESRQLWQEILPESIRRKYGLAEINFALRQIHFPKNREDFFRARERLVFEEFLTFVLALRKTKEHTVREKNGYPMENKKELDAFTESLPYELTGAQKRVWEEIRGDLTGSLVMSRLVQGDVGSGKTILAVLALFLTGLNGYQGALMAPTEVLARQHYASVCRFLEESGLPLRAELLTGSMKAKEKRETYERIASGEVQIIVGTHALIQEKAVYHSLALVVTDEQHRFGVKQREALAGKGSMPHVLVMSATPIPRTLAIILYGDLDISVVDELPASRLPIKNCVVDTGYRKTACRFMKQQVKAGRQCYVICPMVEESEALEAENVTDYARMLAKEMGPDICVRELHGRMKQEQKDEIMEGFGRGEIQILVSTTVIEVGIDVPNATVMMVENAERFGLAQLHQLRGRVGRGQYQSYCIFMSGSRSKETKKRLEILNSSNDGFYIASEDLKLRGPGDLFGIRQSGLMNFKIGDVFQDAGILQKAAAAAGEILEDSPELAGKNYHKLETHVERYLSRSVDFLTL